ncbi:uncharacterized protein LOC102613204 isoform X5 [Citrus sinensis]|uniref:uncharacterized protein LOC102613204 isoform X5 n=1 Tax=Citrus sinensis TaxID=2711 RepID=UPI00227835B3|nr:uncharacterized protein LOC102613204 isoform X5 [Citrus sinensis]
MDLDTDLFADESGPAVNHVRGRFQPKAKPRPRNERTASVDVIDKDSQLLDPVVSSVPASEVVRTVEHFKENESSENALHSEVTASDGCGDLLSSFQKAAGQNADVLSGLESLNDFQSQSSNGTEMPALIVSDYNGGEAVVFEGLSSDNNAAPGVCDAAQAETSADMFLTQDPISCGQAALTNNAGGIPVDDARLEREVQQDGAFPDLNFLDSTSEEAVASGQRAAKYKPRPQFMSEGSIPASVPEDCFDYSSIDLDGTTPPDPTSSEFPVNEELTNFAETSFTDAAASGDMQHEDFPATTESQSAMGKETKASTVLSLSQRLIESSQAGKETEVGKLLRQLRKGVVVPELVDEPDNEARNDGSFSAEPPSNAVDEDEGDVGGNSAEKTSEKKRAPRKSKETVSENGKTVRKRKKANEASDTDKNPPKKFSHSTRRKRRIVNKELLQTPEDEIDPQKVPMKDLILLAEYKERLASKEAKATGTPLKNQSAEHSSREEDYHNEDETFASEQDNGSFGDPATDRVQPRVHFFNYQSFMKKTPTVRWSKQETELFYEAIRQFGTDLSMIQQLFPGRTRQQVKLKYKKEEREHPLRLTEALTNRAKDHSHFEKVIEQLQQFAAQAAQDAKEDDSASMIDEDLEELNPQYNDKAEKVEQDQNAEADVNEVHSPMKDDENADDYDDIWNSYKSEF